MLPGEIQKQMTLFINPVICRIFFDDGYEIYYRLLPYGRCNVYDTDIIHIRNDKNILFKFIE